LEDVTRTATVRALVDTKVLSIARQDFRALVQHLPILRATVSETARVTMASIERGA
jgi:CRP-like cAMP-binding protein